MQDPEGLKITYTVVAGSMPPGIKLDKDTGAVKGVIPDADATYIFTVRATDGHGKYADNVFKIVTRGKTAFFRYFFIIIYFNK